MLKRIIKASIRGLYRASLLGQSTGPHVTRYYMYRHFSGLGLPVSPTHKVLSISGSERAAKLIGYTDPQIVDVSYPEYTVLDLRLPDGEFDAVVSDQVLEHIEGDPHKAIEECFRVLKPGGLALHATCFVQPIHWGPKDFWRFSPDALVYLVEKHADVIDSGGWGNPYIWPYSQLGLRYEPISNCRWHPGHWLATKNVKSWPVVTWVVAQKKFE